MKFNEQVLQEAVARYCAENQDKITSGELTEAMLQESILSGIQSMFGTGSNMRQAGGNVLGAVKDKFHQVKDTVAQGVKGIQNDYHAGAAAGALRQLAQERMEAEEDFQDHMAAFKQQVAQIQAQRYALRKEHRGILRAFHQKAHQQYVRAGQALEIPFVKGDSFYDAVDQALEGRKLVPQVLTETVNLLAEGPWSYNPSQIEINNQEKVINDRRADNMLRTDSPRATVANYLDTAAERRSSASKPYNNTPITNQYGQTSPNPASPNLKNSARQYLDAARQVNKSLISTDSSTPSNLTEDELPSPLTGTPPEESLMEAKAIVPSF